MAAASVSTAGATGPTLGFDDYSLYSGLTEDELLELAIERSLTEANAQASDTHGNKNPAVPSRPNRVVRRTAPPQQQCVPPPANPPAPRENAQMKIENIEGHFITGNGKRMVRWRRYDGSLQVAPEPIEQADPLLKAIWEGDERTVRELSKGSARSLTEPSYRDGWIALHEAAYFGQLGCLKILLKAQPGMINKRSHKDQTPLFLAVSRNQVTCVEHLLQKGADPDSHNRDRETPLFKACERENATNVALILNAGAQVNKPCIQNWTALHEAVCRNNLEICEMLVKAGAKVGAANIYGITPLFVAAQTGRIEALRFLVKNGADLNTQANDGATALYEASKNGHDMIVEFLLSQNADANKAAKSGLLPLHIAAQRGNEVTVSLLIPKTSRARIRRSGISPLHLAAERNRDEVLEYLIEAGFDVNAMLSDEHSKMYEDRRSTPLYFAVINNNIEATTMLLEAGANPNLDTFSPLMVALRQGCIQTVTLLVEHGANVNAYIPTHPTSFPGTVMFCMKYLPLLKYLMDNGCDALSCFQCQYGSNPHPPIKTTRSRNDEDQEHRFPRNPVQFCEVISAPTNCRWAGPIIDVLLDYVGNVPLCSRLIEHLDSYADWAVIKEKAEPPRPLMQLCRLKICSVMGSRHRRLEKLPLPARLIKYLKHDERYKENDY